VIFRDDLNHDCETLPEEEWRVVSVLTVAAPRRPKVTPDKEFANPQQLEDLREKIRLVYRMAASNGNQFIVLGTPAHSHVVPSSSTLFGNSGDGLRRV
jgi:hypothetical protein